jgi:hypothetical protein
MALSQLLSFLLPQLSGITYALARCEHFALEAASYYAFILFELIASNAAWDYALVMFELFAPEAV